MTTQTSTEPAAVLNEIRDRYEDIAHGPAYVEDIRASAEDVPRLLAALDEVLKLADKDGTTGVPPVRLHEAISRALSGGAA